MSRARKALAAPLAPVLLAILLGISSGEWDFEVIALGLSGFVAALVVYLVPNSGVAPPSESEREDPEYDVRFDEGQDKPNLPR